MEIVLDRWRRESLARRRMRGRCSPGKLLAWWSPVRWTGYETSGRRLQLGSSLETRVADPDTHYFGLDPDQHYFLKLDPDPH